MSKSLVVELDWRDKIAVEAARDLIVSVFGDEVRYASKRIASELRPLPKPHYRQFLAIWHEGRMVGAAGIKGADWASDTHLLYLSAVHADHRGKGFGRALVETRLDWIRERHENGKILASTFKPRRYRQFGFVPIGRAREDTAQLMLLEF